MIDLLDLTKAKEGRNLIEDDVSDFPATVREVANTFVRDAKRKEIDLLLLENPSVSQLVVQRRVRQAISIFVANAVQNTSIGTVK